MLLKLERGVIFYVPRSKYCWKSMSFTSCVNGMLHHKCSARVRHHSANTSPIFRRPYKGLETVYL